MMFILINKPPCNDKDCKTCHPPKCGTCGQILPEPKPDPWGAMARPTDPGFYSAGRTACGKE